MAETLSHAGPGNPVVGSRLSIKNADGKWLVAVLDAADSGAPSRFPFCVRYDASLGGKAWVRFVDGHVLEAQHTLKSRAKGAASLDAAPPADAAPQLLPFIVLPDGSKTVGRPSREVTSLREAAEKALQQHLQQLPPMQQLDDVAEGSPPKKRRVAGSRPAGHQERAAASNGSRWGADNQRQQQGAAATSGGQGCAWGAGELQHGAEGDGLAAAAAAAAGAPPAAGQAANGGPQPVVTTSLDGAARGVAPPPRHAQSSVTEVGGSSFAPLATVEVTAKPAARASAGSQQRRDSSRPASRASAPVDSQEWGRSAGQAASHVPHAGAVDDGDADPAPAPPPQRPWENACRDFAQLLPGLTLLKESISSAAAAAIRAGQQGGCKEVVRSVLEHMRREPAVSKRVVHFFLLDAVLAFSRRDVAGCGPSSPVGTLFPRTVGAALSQLVELLAASREAAQKMERTLTRTWLASDKRGVEASLVQRALEMLRDRLAQHAAAWGDGDAGNNGGSGGAARAAAGGRGPAAGSARASSSGLPGGLPLDEAQLRQLARRVPLRAAPMLTYVDVRDGRRVRLTHAWHPPCWPDYAALPLDPGAAQQQFAAQLATAAAAQQGHADAGEPCSPWHQAHAQRQAEASQAWAHQQQQRQGLGDGEAAAQAARLAAAQRAAQHALRGVQSTAAAAEVDEFDAGLFREVAGGVVPSSANQPPFDPDLSGLLGDMGWGGGASLQPPLPDQPPPLPGETGYEEEDTFGPPPLPPHSPPKDEYRLEETPPPLPPDERGARVAPLLPPPGPHGTPAMAVPPLGYQGTPVGGYGTPLDYAPGRLPQHAALQGPSAWMHGIHAAAPQQGMMPPGFGVGPGPSPAAMQQQAWMAHHHQEQLQRQHHQMQQQHGFMQQHHQQQQAAMMAGFAPAALAGMQGQQHQMPFSPPMAPGPMNPAMLMQQPRLGVSGRGRPGPLPPPR